MIHVKYSPIRNLWIKVNPELFCLFSYCWISVNIKRGHFSNKQSSFVYNRTFGCHEICVARSQLYGYDNDWKTKKTDSGWRDSGRPDVRRKRARRLKIICRGRVGLRRCTGRPHRSFRRTKVYTPMWQKPVVIHCAYKSLGHKRTIIDPLSWTGKLICIIFVRSAWRRKKIM